MNTSTHKFNQIIVVANEAIPKARDFCHEVFDTLRALGAQVSLGLINFDKNQQSCDLENQDLVIALGGDGTMLRCGHLCAQHNLPLLGINIGRFGFLTELSSENWQAYMKPLLLGDFRIEKRMMLKTQFYQSEKLVGSWDVLNEVVVCRGRYVRPIELKVEINEGYLTSYVADGLITATATGSTAYALAAGGPILPPELRNILLIPIAPHLSLDRAIILSDGASVCVQVNTDHEAVFSVDGQDPVLMQNNDLLRIVGNENTLKMVRFQDPHYFYRNLTSYMENNPVFKIKKDDTTR